MKLLSSVVIPVVLLFSCQSSKQRQAVNDTYITHLTAKEVDAQLTAIYNISDSTARMDSLDRFLTAWNQALSADSVTADDAAEQAVFEIFNTVYQPFDLLKLGKWEWGNKLNEDARYALIQNEIHYRLLKTDDLDDVGGAKEKTISDFLPTTRLKRSQVLYLTPPFAEGIERFLGSEQTEMGEGNIMNPSRPRGESVKRYRMLRPFVPILHGHNSGWNIETSPTIGSITLNKSLTMARVNFVVGYQGGQALLKKSGNDWTITESNATWIE